MTTEEACSRSALLMQGAKNDHKLQKHGKWWTDDAECGSSMRRQPRACQSNCMSCQAWRYWRYRHEEETYGPNRGFYYSSFEPPPGKFGATQASVSKLAYKQQQSDLCCTTA